MKQPFRALIVDDVRLARQYLRMLFAEFPEIEVVAEAENIRQAVEAIQREQPDVVFLDIELSGESGFKLLEEVDVDFKVVFITTYDHYAVRAFEVNACDYLLKPVSKKRFAQTVARLLNNTGKDHNQAEKSYNYSDYVLTKTDGRIEFIKVESIV